MDGPLKLTPDECKFVAVYAETSDRVAAVQAAYPDVPPMERHQAANVLMSRPWVAAVVAQVRERTLDRLGLTLADVIAGLQREIDDPASKPSDRIAAWKAIAKISGLDAPRRHEHGFGDSRPTQGGLPARLVEQIGRKFLGLPPAADSDTIDAEVIECKPKS